MARWLWFSTSTTTVPIWGRLADLHGRRLEPFSRLATIGLVGDHALREQARERFADRQHAFVGEGRKHGHERGSDVPWRQRVDDEEHDPRHSAEA